MKFEFIIVLDFRRVVLVLAMHFNFKILILFHVCLLIFQLIPRQINLLRPSMNSSLTSAFGFSSSASPEPASEEPKATTDQSEQDKGADQTKGSGSISESRSQSVKRKE